MADPGFPVGGACTRWGGGRGPPTRVLFGENVCENERIGSYRGLRAPGTPPLDLPIQVNYCERTSLCTLPTIHQSGICEIKYTLIYNIKYIKLYLIYKFESGVFFSSTTECTFTKNLLA